MPRPTVVVAVCATLCAALAPRLLAQVNIERLRRTRDGEGLSGAAGADLATRTGNVQLVLVKLNGRLDYRRPRWLAFAVGATDLGWEGGQRFSNAGLLHLRYNYLPTPTLAAELFAQLDYDRARLLAFRALAGGGPRFNLTHAAPWHLALGTALMLEHERLDLPAGDSEPSRTDVVRWSSYVSASHAVSPRRATVATVYAQPRIGDAGDTRILADLRFAVQLVGAVSLTVSSHLRYDSRPPDGIRRVDTAVTAGVALEW